MVTRLRAAVALVVVPAVACALLAGITGGLLRAGVELWGLGERPWPTRALLFHGALIIGAFMGTVIGIERAVAVKLRAAWLAPVTSGAAGVALMLGLDVPGRWLLVAASLAFACVNILVVRRQRAAHTGLLLAGALCWLAGNALFALEWGMAAIVPWWFGFLVMTIASERLEMTRLMRRRPAAQPALLVLMGALAASAAATSFAPRAGGLLYGLALVLLAAWLFFFDIARRTIRSDGLPRYMAVCLLGGYAWLAVAGTGWMAAALGWSTRDASLHALGLGFVVSMMMGHAPVILPAIAKVKLLFGRFFYLPLALLHLSLFARLGGGWNNLEWRAAGSVWNALAIAVFAATVAGAALLWVCRHGRLGRPPA